MIGLSGLSDETLMGGPSFDDLSSAVEWAESRGRDNALGPVTRSGERAVGPMQLMRGAVIDYLMANGLPADPDTVLSFQTDPVKNREIGRWYLKQQHDRFGGDTDRALAAYNWGPARVQRLGDDFALDRLPPETRNYIQSIRGRMGEQPPAPGAPQGEPPMAPQDFDAAYDSVMNYQPEPMRPQMAGVGAMPPPQPKAGLSAMSSLNPMLELAQQISPSPDRGPAWANALIQAGGAMMASNRPDFLGAAGQGVLAGHNAYQQGIEQQKRDRLGQLDLGLKLNEALRKDDKPTVVPENGSVWLPGIGFVKNPTAGSKAQSEIGKIIDDYNAGRISRDERNDALAKLRGENESPVAKLRREREQFAPGSQEYKEYTDAISRAGGGVTVNNSPEGRFQSGMGELRVKVVEDARAQATNAMGMLPAFEQMKSALDAGLPTGQFAPFKDMFARVALDLGAPEDVVNTFWNAKDARVFDSASKSLVLGIIKGLGANPSNADREFIEKTLPNLRDPVQAARAIMEHARTRAETRISYYEGLNTAIKNSGDPIQFEIEWMRKNLGDTPWKNSPKDAATPAPASAPPPPSTSRAPAPPPTSSLKVTTPTADGMGTKTTQVPIEGEGGAAPLPRGADGKIERGKLIEGQTYAGADGKRYRFNGTSFEAQP